MSSPRITRLTKFTVFVLLVENVLLFSSAFSNHLRAASPCRARNSECSLQSSFYAEYLESVPEDIKEEARSSMPLIVDKMPDPLPDTLQNKYYLLRHGQSTANIAEIISSSRSLAYSEKHGLTVLGYQQGRASAGLLLDVLQKEGAKEGDNVLFVSSPFARARQTAEACLEGLNLDETNNQRVQQMGIKIVEEIEMENDLMERYFGRLDFDRIYTYAYVWPMDAINTTHTAFGVESVAAVCTRLSRVLNQLESQYQGFHIVLVSHADVLQIAQLFAAHAPNVGTFSSYRFQNGEVRAMRRTPDSLPKPSPLEAPQRGTSKFVALQS